MSQYGAYGFAQHGATYDAILGHYYTGTELGTTDPARTVRVLLQSDRHGELQRRRRAPGTRKLNPAQAPTACAATAPTQVDLLSAARQARSPPSARRCRSPGPDGVVRARRRRAPTAARSSSGPARSAASTRSTRSRSRTTCAASSRASRPSSWPAEALKAQAVAARTYAITTSQGAARASTSTPTRARRSTAASPPRRRPPTRPSPPRAARSSPTTASRSSPTSSRPRAGAPRTSRTRSSAAEPQPWLKSVEDPYDDVSPKHRWGPIRMTLPQRRRQARAASSRAASSGIEVVKRGTLAADRQRRRRRHRRPHARRRRDAARPPRPARHLGLLHLDRHAQEEAADGRPGHRRRQAAGREGRRPAAARLLAGTVVPGARRRRGADPASARAAAGTPSPRTVVRRGGRYSAAVAAAGTYRAVFSGDAGPSVRVG